MAAFPKGKWRWAVIAVLVMAVLARLPIALTQPMTHDESYTYIAFASQPLTTVVSDYHLPNNHILHSVLVHLSTRLFGEQPLAVRLPAFVAGVLIVIAVYLLARVMYGDPPALLAASVAAFLPALSEISAEARGYSLLTLLVLMEFLLAMYLHRHRNIFGWLLFSALGALGFFTVPIMLYPIGMIGLWLVLNGLAGDIGKEYPSRWHFAGWLIGAVILTAVFTLILYSPVLKYSGMDALLQNPFVKPLSMHKFLDLLPNRVAETWQIWQAGTVKILWLAPVGFFLSLIFTKEGKNARIPIQTGLIWIILAALIQHPNPWPKIFVYLLPLLIIWGTGGWYLLLQRWIKQKSLSVTLTAFAVLILTAGAIRDIPKILKLPAEPGELERAVMVVAREIETGDVLVAASPIDSPAWYYARLHGIAKETYTHLEERTIRHAFVLVSSAEGQTIETVLNERQLNPDQFDLNSSKLSADLGSILVYRLYGK